MKILIIDDDPVVRHILSAVLNGYSAQFLPPGESGVELAVATNGREGVEALPAGTPKELLPALIFLDLQLIDMTGVEVLEALEKAFGSDLPPVAIMSAQPVEEVRKQYRERAFPLFLQKPFTPDQIISSIKSAFPA